MGQGAERCEGKWLVTLLFSFVHVLGKAWGRRLSESNGTGKSRGGEIPGGCLIRSERDH